VLRPLVRASVCLLLLSFPAHAGPIHSAAQKGDAATVCRLLAEDAGLANAKDAAGNSPLQWAALGGHLEAVRCLVEKGADVNAADGHSDTSLHEAAAADHGEVVAFLCEHGARIDHANYKRKTPLHLAATAGATAAVKALVTHGATLEARDEQGRTPLVLGAREKGGPEVARLLLAAGADVRARDDSGSDALELAAWRGYANVVDVLLDNKAPVPTEERPASQMLSFSAEGGLTRLFRLLVAQGADPTHPNTKKGTLLHDAAAGGSAEILADLIDKGLDVRAKDRYGWTPAHYAALEGREAALKTLLEKGADPNARNVMGQSPLNVAEEGGHAALKALLLARKADPGPVQFPVLKGDYAGQEPPGRTPKVFAPGIVSSIRGLHSTVAFSPDGNEAFWSPMDPKSPALLGMMRVKGQWTAPERASFSSAHRDDVPFFAPDGKRLYFLSTRPIPGHRKPGYENVWFVDRTASGWSEPRPLGREVNALEMHWQFSVDRTGSVYFGSHDPGGKGGGDIWVSRFENGRHRAPVNLGAPINTAQAEGEPFIAPDGTYLLFSRDMDLYVSFLRKDGGWTEPLPLGPGINTRAYELCPQVSADGRYLFFLSSRTGENAAFWVEAGFLEEMRKTARLQEPAVALSARLWERAEQAGVPAALELYRELRRRDPEGFRALPWDQELNRFGYRLDGLGRYAEAIEVFRLNVENTPEHWGPHDSLAEACMHAGLRDRAIEHYRRSVELNPKNQEGARFLFLLENYEKQTVRIPMRDGVKLFTQIYAPRDRARKHPVMLYRTPYGNPPYNPSTMRTGFGIAWKMAEEGTIFVFQDVRGTRLSGGTFVPMRPLRDPGTSGGIDESTDAWDTIEWLLKNVPHQNGRVGMRGNSFAGLYALMGALSRHPALVAVSPQAPPIDWFRGDDMHTNGALNLLMAANWLRTNGVVRAGPDEKEVPPVLDLRCPDLFTFFRQAGPLSTWNARYFKDRVPFWNDLMTHSTYDAFWKARNVLPHLSNLSAAVLMVGGWFDAEDPYGPVAAYSEIERRQPGNFSTLVMGPWYHGGWTRSDGERLGDVDVDSSEASRFFRLEVELPFFDHHLRGAKSPGLPEALVFDTGTAEWRSLAAWPPADVHPTAFYFRGNGLLDTDAPTGEAAFDEFPSDPARPVPFSPWIEREWNYRFMTADQRFAASRPDVLTYATGPLPEDLTVVGPVGAELFVSTTGTDADWVVKVVDVYPDDTPDYRGMPETTRMGGYQALVRQSVLRGRFRGSLETPEPFVPGRVERLAFDLPDVCHTFRKGHRLMVQVQSSSFPLYDVNPQRFVHIPSARTGDFQKALHRVYRGPGQLSSIRVQRLRQQAPRAAHEGVAVPLRTPFLEPG